MYEGFLPCNGTDDETDLTNLEPIPFEIGDSIVEHILVPDCRLSLKLYDVRTIDIEEGAREVISTIKKTGQNTRRVELIIKFVNKEFDCYIMNITLPSI